MREIILRFEMKLQNLIFFWQFNSYLDFKTSTEELSNWTIETLGDNSPPAEASTQGLKCKTNMLTVLMHQMSISTTQISSVMLRSKKLESQEKNAKPE
jgi:hypothetical protein